MALVKTDGPKDAFEITSPSQLVRVLQGTIADEHSASSLYSSVQWLSRV